MASGESPAGRSLWRWTGVTIVIPLTAIFHHAIFFFPRCIWKPFAPDFEISLIAVGRWLLADPSLAWAIAAALAIHRAGSHRPRLRAWVAPIFPSFLPLSVWIWDLFPWPRFFCEIGHDGKTASWIGFAVRSRSLYIFGAGMFVLLLVLGRRRSEQEV